jgi:hypothetical protein
MRALVAGIYVSAGIYVLYAAMKHSRAWPEQVRP